MSVAERQDALEVVNEWDDLDTQEQSSEAQPQETDDRPDPEATTQDRRPETGTEAPATPVADSPEARLLRIEAEIAQERAEKARLQKMIDDREWSDRGRLKQAQKELELTKTRLAEIESARASEDDILRERYDTAIAQQIAAGNDLGAKALRSELRAEMAERKAGRLEQAQQWEQHQRQELEQAQAEDKRMRAGREVQSAFIPTMQAEAVAAAKQFGLDEAETEDLVAFATPRSLRSLAPNAPPEVLGQLAMEQYAAIVERAQQYQARRVQRNQQSFDTTRETAGNGATRDLDKEWEEADFDEANELLRQGYVPKEKGKRRR